ncbi:MAG: riboflavin synthase subunit alpha [Pseudomonadales bacterium]|jgi:riboflavin synthase
MYTGIVQEQLAVKSVDKKDGLTSFSIGFPEYLLQGLETGASVSVNGVCFTVTSINSDEISFDAVRETLELSNIKYLEAGTMVNIERSAKQGAEVGGHVLSGHVVGTARVQSVELSENNCRMTFSGDPSWLKYVFDKGFLAINGASLTVAALDRQATNFSINLIPETLKRTNFSLLKQDDEVNIEIESQTQVIVDTVERVMAERY